MIYLLKIQLLEIKIFKIQILWNIIKSNQRSINNLIIKILIFI